VSLTLLYILKGHWKKTVEGFEVPMEVLTRKIQGQSPSWKPGRKAPGRHKEQSFMRALSRRVLLAGSTRGGVACYE
jgi:hypothetical protein